MKDILLLEAYLYDKDTEKLTMTQKMVLWYWLKTGKTRSEIADSLYVSEKTVKKHIENINKKLELGSRSQAQASYIEFVERRGVEQAMRVIKFGGLKEAIKFLNEKEML